MPNLYDRRGMGLLVWPDGALIERMAASAKA